MRLRSKQWLLIGLCAALVLAVACAGETVVETVIVEKIVPGEKVVETVIVVATPTPAEAKPPAGPTGSIMVAAKDNGIAVGTVHLCLPGCSNEKAMVSGFETLLRVTVDDELVGQLAESWELAPDLSKWTWKLRKGIPWHQGYGEFTADDVVYTVNSVNSNITAESIHDQSSDLVKYGEAVKVDDYTVVMNLNEFDANAPWSPWSPIWQTIPMSSKKVFDELGAEAMREVFVGTGPFEIVEWITDDHTLLRAVPNHWRKTAGVNEIKIVEVKEEASRMAMFETGEAEVVEAPVQFLPQLAKKGGVPLQTGSRQFVIRFTANYLDNINPVDGSAVANPGYDKAKVSQPWVADYDAPGCDYAVYETSLPEGPVCDEIENARKVRLAMSMVIDREQIVKELQYGYGWPDYLNYLSGQSPYMKDEWVVPYDPNGARQLMKEAGYPDGFETQIHIGDVPEEHHTAIPGIWEAELGITATFSRIDYSSKRKQWVPHEATDMELSFSTMGMPADKPLGGGSSNWGLGGTAKEGGNPFSRITYGLMSSEPDMQKRLEYAEAWWAHYDYWNWIFAVTHRPLFKVYDGNQLVWEPESKSNNGLLWLYPLEDIVWK